MANTARVLSSVALLSLVACDPFAGGAANTQGSGGGGGGGDPCGNGADPCGGGE